MSERWIVWAWNSQAGLWLQLDEGSREDMEKSLAGYAKPGQDGPPLAMSKQGDPLPPPPDGPSEDETARRETSRPATRREAQ